MIDRDKEKKSLRIHFFGSSLFDQEGNLDWSQITKKSVAFMGFFLLLFTIILFFIKDYYLLIGQWVTEHLGFFGVGLFVYITDTFILPITADIIFPFVLSYRAVPLIIMLSLASALGGISGYWIGRLLGHLNFIKRISSSFNRDGEHLVNLYGGWAIAIAAITPIPYSTVCWIAGMLKVNPYVVALASLARFPRMIIYYLLIKGGLSFVF